MDITFNVDKQHTLASEIRISGTGLHTGQLVNMVLKPADPGFGFRFQRTDLPGSPVIKADCDLVSSTDRGTTLEDNGVKISTVEHILAAFVGMGVDNALIELDGQEIPIIDGSSQPFTNLIEQTGVQEQDAEKVWHTLDDNICFSDESKRVELMALPASSYKITTLIDFDSPVLGTQYADLKNIMDFKTEIAPCRTFSFLHELQMLLDHDLIKGGDINNAIVVVDKPVTEEEMTRLAKAFGREKVEVKSEGYLNNLELRFPNEPARHKLLDIVGDLALTGYAVKAQVIANRPGHSSNVAFAKKIKQFIRQKSKMVNVPAYDPNRPPIYNAQQIEATLPHRYPFLLVDKIIDLGEKHITGVKNVTFNEPFFVGHFPGNPIMPGVLQIEALAQTGGILAINALPEGKYDTYFLKIDNCKFKKMVVPGDTMILKLELTSPIRRGICEMNGTVFVGNKVCTEATLTAQLVKQQ